MAKKIFVLGLAALLVGALADIISWIVAVLLIVALAIVTKVAHAIKNKKKDEKFGDTNVGAGLALIFCASGVLGVIVLAGAILVQCVSSSHDGMINWLDTHHAK